MGNFTASEVLRQHLVDALSDLQLVEHGGDEAEVVEDLALIGSLHAFPRERWGLKGSYNINSLRRWRQFSHAECRFNGFITRSSPGRIPPAVFVAVFVHAPALRLRMDAGAAKATGSLRPSLISSSQIGACENQRIRYPRDRGRIPAADEAVALPHVRERVRLDEKVRVEDARTRPPRRRAGWR